MSKSLPYPESARIFSTRAAQSFEIEALRVALHGRSFPPRLVDAEFRRVLSGAARRLVQYRPAAHRARRIARP